MVLEDVTEFDYSSTPTKLSKILLNGNNICMVRKLRFSFINMPLIYGSSFPEVKAHFKGNQRSRTEHRAISLYLSLFYESFYDEHSETPAESYMFLNPSQRQ